MQFLHTRPARIALVKESLPTSRFGVDYPIAHSCHAQQTQLPFAEACIMTLLKRPAANPAGLARKSPPRGWGLFLARA